MVSPRHGLATCLLYDQGYLCLISLGLINAQLDPRLSTPCVSDALCYHLDQIIGWHKPPVSLLDEPSKNIGNILHQFEPILQPLRLALDRTESVVAPLQ